MHPFPHRAYFLLRYELCLFSEQQNSINSVLFALQYRQNSENSEHVHILFEFSLHINLFRKCHFNNCSLQITLCHFPPDVVKKNTTGPQINFGLFKRDSLCNRK